MMMLRWLCETWYDDLQRTDLLCCLDEHVTVRDVEAGYTSYFSVEPGTGSADPGKITQNGCGCIPASLCSSLG